MQYSFAMLAAAAAVYASPVALPQGVTEAISPTAPAPAGCSPNYSGTFGIAVMNATGAADTGSPMESGYSSAPVSSIMDGQPQASTGYAPVTTIADGQPQASTAPAVTTIQDGQPQAPTAPAVTTIADGQPQAPTAPAVTTIADGQPQAPTAPAVSQISDGQPQAPTMSVAPVTQISDGQIQATTYMTMTPINQITDGQIQNTMPLVSTIADGQPQAPTAPAVSTIADGQPQAPTATAPPVSTIQDGQPQAPTSAVSQISDGQPQASASASASGSPDNFAANAKVQMVSCKADDTLSITLADGVLTDDQGRTGYIASNYQFQFDGPPQAGAIYTAGFSVCGNGSLALGGSNIFYQCLSGDFYNLYDRMWAPQCVPITINVVELMDC